MKLIKTEELKNQKGGVVLSEWNAAGWPIGLYVFLEFKDDEYLCRSLLPEKDILSPDGDVRPVLLDENESYIQPFNPTTQHLAIYSQDDCRQMSEMFAKAAAVE